MHQHLELRHTRRGIPVEVWGDGRGLIYIPLVPVWEEHQARLARSVVRELTRAANELDDEED